MQREEDDKIVHLVPNMPQEMAQDEGIVDEQLTEAWAMVQKNFLTPESKE